MRVGVIGVGRIGSFHAGVLARHPQVEQVLLADPDLHRAETVAREVGGRTVASVEALLGAVDAVVIASPTITHADLIRQAVDADRPTFCEKPITIDLASTEAVIAHVRRRDAIVQVGFQRRFDEGYRRARELVACGTLGQLYVVRMAGHDPRPPDVATAVATLRFDGGTLGILSGTRHDPLGYDIRLEVFGAGDSVAVGWDERMPMRSVEPGAPPGPREPYSFFLDRFAPAYRAELHAFVDVAAGRLANPCPPEHAREAIRVAMACDRSRELHRPVRVEEVA